MVNGRIAQEMPTAELAADRELQERLLGVRSGDPDEDARAWRSAAHAARPVRTDAGVHGAPRPRRRRALARRPGAGHGARLQPLERRRHRCAGGRHRARTPPWRRRAPAPRPAAPRHACFDFPVAASSGRAAYVAGTFDTKGRELFFLRQCLEKLGLRVVTVDLADLGQAVARQRASARGRAPPPAGRSSGVQRRSRQRDRRRWRWPSSASCSPRRDLGGLISAGGSGGTSLATPGHARAADRLPKVMVSTMASGDTRPVRRPERHLHDVFGDRRAGHQSASARRCWPTPRMRWPA